MVPRRPRAPARIAHRRTNGVAPGRPASRQPISDPRRGQRGGEHGVGAVDRPAVLFVEPHLDLGHVTCGEDAEGADRQVDRFPGLVDGDAFAPHHAERLVHSAERVRAQGHRTEERTGPDIDLGPAPRPRAEIERDPRAPRSRHGQVDRATARLRRRRGERRLCREHFGPPRTTQRRRHRWTDDVDHLDVDGGAARPQHAPHCVQVAGGVGAPDPHQARAVGAKNHCQRRPLGPAPHHVLAPPEHAHRVAGLGGQLSGVGGHRAVALAPESAAVGQRRGGRVAGTAPARIGLDVGRFDPRCLEREGPVAHGHLHRVGQGDGAVASLHAPCAGPRGAEVRGERRIRPELDQCTPWRRVVGEATASEHHVGTRGLEGRSFDLGPPTG